MSSLFHSFPRPLKNEPPDLEMGLQTLLGFFKINGFVLTPEDPKMHELFSNGQKGRELTIIQKRMCFTHIEESQLNEHANAFGPFSIEFDLTEMSRIGAMPAFYYPIPDAHDDLAGLSQMLILKLGDTFNYIGELLEIREKITGHKMGERLEFNWGEGSNKKTTSLPVGFLAALTDYLHYRHGDVRELHDHIKVLAQLFSPTHNKLYTGPFAYYQQHEWRVIANIAFMNKPLCSPVTNEEKNLLLLSNKRFFEKETELKPGIKRPRVDECIVYRPPKIDHIMALAKRIIVPEKCISKAQTIIQAAEFKKLQVVALESFLRS